MQKPLVVFQGKDKTLIVVGIEALLSLLTKIFMSHSKDVISVKSLAQPI